jgi:Na+/melibiose symporter-like transporter
MYLTKKTQIISIIAIYLTVITYINITTRIDLSQTEYKERISPVIETLKITKNDDWILSDISSVFHLYATANRNFIDCYYANANRMIELNKNSNGQIYLLLRKTDNLNEIRYPMYSDMIAKLDYIKIKDISPNYELLKLIK